MREIVLDTETTGLDPGLGHRVIEIGAVELVHRRLTGEHFHVYINPERAVDPGAFAVHGLSNEFLADKPRFEEEAEAFLNFIGQDVLIAHNASFDIRFLDSELKRCNPKHRSLYKQCEVIDTLALARKKHPGQKNNLDALCKRYHVDNAHRELHGALLDAEILAQVYLLMTGGQSSLFGSESDAIENQASSTVSVKDAQALAADLRVVQATAEEVAAHNAYCERLRENATKT